MVRPKFEPYIPAKKNVREFTVRAIVLGVLLGILFAIANAYLALKIGIAISASIPAAIISMAIFRLFSRASILENNLVQTIATVGEGLAAGVVFTIPALIFLGAPASIGRIFLLSVLGGILGILFMIPMRRHIIVKEHGVLPFPEGTACAEILKAGEKNRKSAMMAGWGLISGAIYKILCNGFNLWEETPFWEFPSWQKVAFSLDASPALLGVGYIIGPRVCSLLLAGGAFGWWVIIPLMNYFGNNQIISPGTVPIAELGPKEIWSQYLRYIGAGAIAIGGLLSLFRVLPLLYRGMGGSFKNLFEGLKKRSHLERTDRDIPTIWLILGSLAIILTLWLFPTLPMNLFTILLLVILGFFFVCVASITVGMVGSTSNPASGMTLTTLLITCIVFVLLGWRESVYLISAITMSCVACIAICLASTTSQDLKAGFLLGATPIKQQVGEIIGVFFPAIAIGGAIYILNLTYHIGSPAMPAPQAALIAMIAKGVIHGDLPYALVAIGIILGLILELLRIPILPFAIGLYLPLSLSTAMMSGAIVAVLVQKFSKRAATTETGVLLSSGLIGGDACIGIFIAGLTVLGVISPETKALLPSYISLIAFILLGLGLGYFILRESKKNATH